MVVEGLTEVELLPDEEVKSPGEIEMDVAPAVDQLKELLPPEVMVPGLAENDEIVGAEPFEGGGGSEWFTPAQAASTKQARSAIEKVQSWWDATDERRRAKIWARKWDEKFMSRGTHRLRCFDKCRERRSGMATGREGRFRTWPTG